MRKILPKFIATFLGIVLIFGAAQTALAVDVSTDLVLKDLTCSFIYPTNLTGCFPITVFNLIYVPTTWVLILTGYMFDTSLALSINTAFVDQKFVGEIWTIVRDFSNMLFIFILLYTGIQAIFGVNWRGTVLKVVILALLINFSLFFTKVVIDAGNILAVGIYESMGAVKDTGAMIKPGAGIQERRISEALIGNFQPQKFLAVSGDTKTSGTDATVVFIVAIIVSGFAAFIMFQAALLFVGRLLAFWFVMISSPFAFISMAIPGINFFDRWLKILINQAFVAPVFLFLMYVLMRIISAGGGVLSSFAGPSVGAEKFLFDTLLGPILIAIIVITALKKILGVAQSMSDEFGEVGSKIISGAMGAAGMAAGGLGMASGLAGVVGRNTVGRLAAKRLAEGKYAEGTPEYEKALRQSKASFDLRDKIPTSMKDPRKYLEKGVGKGGYEKSFIDSNKAQVEKDIAEAKSKEINVFRQEQLKTEGSEAKPKYEAAQTKVTSATAEVKSATEKKVAAEAAHTAMRNSGKLKQAIKDEYDRAKAEEAEAIRKLAEANTELAEVSKVYNSKDRIKTENKERQLAYATKLENEGRQESADKIREAYKTKKPKDVLIEALANMQKEDKEKEEKEKKEREGSHNTEAAKAKPEH